MYLFLLVDNQILEVQVGRPIRIKRFDKGLCSKHQSYFNAYQSAHTLLYLLVHLYSFTRCNKKNFLENRNMAFKGMYCMLFQTVAFLSRNRIHFRMQKL